MSTLFAASSDGWPSNPRKTSFGATAVRLRRSGAGIAPWRRGHPGSCGEGPAGSTTLSFGAVTMGLRLPAGVRPTSDGGGRRREIMALALSEGGRVTVVTLVTLNPNRAAAWAYGRDHGCFRRSCPHHGHDETLMSTVGQKSY
jgi:hypothetical protein